MYSKSTTLVLKYFIVQVLFLCFYFVSYSQFDTSRVSLLSKNNQLEPVSYSQIEIKIDSIFATYPKPVQRRWASSLGAGPVNTKNTYLSPITYSGISLGYYGYLSTYKKWGISDWELDVRLSLFSKVKDSQNEFSVVVRKFWHKQVYQSPNTRLNIYGGLGGNYGMFFNKREYNAGLSSRNSTQLFLHVQPSVLLRYRFKLGGQQFDFNQQFATPVIGLGFLPNRESTLQSSEDTGADHEVFFSSFHNTWGITSHSYIDWHRMKQGKERRVFFRLGVRYDALHIDHTIRYQSDVTAFTLGLVRKL